MFSKHWIRDCSSALVMQEAQPAFRTRALKCLGGAAPLAAAGTKPGSSSRGEGADETLPEKKGSGSRFMLMVRMVKGRWGDEHTHMQACGNVQARTRTHAHAHTNPHQWTPTSAPTRLCARMCRPHTCGLCDCLCASRRPCLQQSLVEACGFECGAEACMCT